MKAGRAESFRKVNRTLEEHSLGIGFTTSTNGAVWPEILVYSSNLNPFTIYIRDNLTTRAEWLAGRLRRRMLLLHQRVAQDASLDLIEQSLVIEHPSEFGRTYAYNGGELVFGHVEKSGTCPEVIGTRDRLFDDP